MTKVYGYWQWWILEFMGPRQTIRKGPQSYQRTSKLLRGPFVIFAHNFCFIMKKNF